MYGHIFIVRELYELVKNNQTNVQSSQKIITCNFLNEMCKSYLYKAISVSSVMCLFCFSDPSPTELISKFLAISADVSSSKEVILLDQDNERDDKPIPCRRSRGLKILALKVAAFLNWDLDILEQK